MGPKFQRARNLWWAKWWAHANQMRHLDSNTRAPTVASTRPDCQIFKTHGSGSFHSNVWSLINYDIQWHSNDICRGKCMHSWRSDTARFTYRSHVPPLLSLLTAPCECGQQTILLDLQHIRMSWYPCVHFTNGISESLRSSIAVARCCIKAPRSELNNVNSAYPRRRWR